MRIHRTAQKLGWEPQVIYKAQFEPMDEATQELVALSKSNGIEVIDPIREIAEDLFELQHPGRLGDAALRGAFIDNVISQGDEFGNWVHFEWARQLVRYPEDQEHQALRRYRDQHLFTSDEQAIMRSSTVAAFGLSVGGAIVRQMVQAGIGDTYVIGDPDKIGPSNLNRLTATMDEVGLSKLYKTARTISKIDPYIRQVHLANGYDDKAEEVLALEQPTIIVEEVDDIRAKARMRKWAIENGADVIMVADVGETPVLHVEPYSQGNIAPFNERISPLVYRGLLDGTLSQQEMTKAMVDVAGREAALRSPRLVKSFMSIGRDVAGIPQLGTTVEAGAALATAAARRLLLGQYIAAGSYPLSIEDVLRVESLTTKDEHDRIIDQFSKLIS